MSRSFSVEVTYVPSSSTSSSTSSMGLSSSCSARAATLSVVNVNDISYDATNKITNAVADGMGRWFVRTAVTTVAFAGAFYCGYRLCKWIGTMVERRRERKRLALEAAEKKNNKESCPEDAKSCCCTCHGNQKMCQANENTADKVSAPSLTESELLIDFDSVTESIYPHIGANPSAPPMITELTPKTKNQLLLTRLQRRVAALEGTFMFLAGGMIALTVIAIKR